MGTDFWLPSPPAEGEVVYVAKNLFYKPTGAGQLHKNNSDCWSMLIVDGPKEALGQEITWFNRKPSDAVDVPMEVAEDIVESYNLMGRSADEPEINIFDINPELLSHPDFNNGMGYLGSANPNQQAHVGGDVRVGDVANLYQDLGFSEHYDDKGWVTTGEGLHGGPEVGQSFYNSMGFAQGDVRHELEYQPMGDTVQMPGARGRSQGDLEFIQPTLRDDEIFYGNSRPSKSPLKKIGLVAAGLGIIGMLTRGKGK